MNEEIMMTNEMTNEEVVTEVETVAEPEKKTRKPRAPKARSIEELVEASTKNMTDKEKTVLIEYLREQLMVKDNMIHFHKTNTEAALEKVQLSEKQYNTMEAHYMDRQKYITDQVKAFANAVLLATKGTIN